MHAPANIDPKIVALYHEYLNAPLRRRIFLKRLSELAGGDATALILVPVIEAAYGPGKGAPHVPSNGKRKP